ncbi:MAG: cell filamentation protein Fic [Verrucomicrobiota bacterium]
MGNAEIRKLLGLTDRAHLREDYVDVALAGGFIEPTIPDKPTSSLQKYRLTDKGRAWLASKKTKGGPP